MSSEHRYEAPRPIRDADQHATFHSGEPSLDEYLRKRALRNHVEGAARTYVATRDGQVVGYYALTSASIGRAQTPGRVRRNMPEPIPAVLLSRLAVDVREQGRRLGAHLLRDAILRSVRVADEIGVRVLVVHALHDRARSFYQRFDFEPSPTDPLHLMLLLNDVTILFG